jgi:hypothetical protein
MATITLRQVKGTPLSIVEVDSNFTNLNTDLIATQSTVSGHTTSISTLNNTVTNLATSPVFSGNVVLSTDTTSSIAINAISNNTHIGGANVGLFGSATNGLTNYALYMDYGDIYSAHPQTWFLNGDLTFNGSYSVIATDFNSISDKSLKSNVKPITNPLNVINSLQGVSFKWKDSKENAYGFIAQEVEKVLPEIISTSEEGIKSVKYLQLIAFLVEAIKDQDIRIKKLELK